MSDAAQVAADGEEQPAPLLLLDVDGPLNAFGGMPDDRPDGFEEFFLMPPSWAALQEQRIAASPRAREPVPLPVWLDPTHGPRLLALPYELAWASTWEAEANEYIGPLIGLPELPWIVWRSPRPAREGRCCWKTPHIVELMAGRPFAWVDDEITSADQEWVAQHHDGPALLHRVDPRTGLTDEDLAALATWAERLVRST